MKYVILLPLLLGSLVLLSACNIATEGDATKYVIEGAPTVEENTAAPVEEPPPEKVDMTTEQCDFIASRYVNEQGGSAGGTLTAGEGCRVFQQLGGECWIHNYDAAGGYEGSSAMGCPR